MTKQKNKKRRNSMIRLNPKQKSAPKGKYPDVEEVEFLINNNLPFSYENKREQFNKKNNGKGVK